MEKDSQRAFGSQLKNMFKTFASKMVGKSEVIAEQKEFQKIFPSKEVMQQRSAELKKAPAIKPVKKEAQKIVKPDMSYRASREHMEFVFKNNRSLNSTIQLRPDNSNMKNAVENWVSNERGYNSYNQLNKKMNVETHDHLLMRDFFEHTNVINTNAKFYDTLETSRKLYDKTASNYFKLRNEHYGQYQSKSNEHDMLNTTTAQIIDCVRSEMGRAHKDEEKLGLTPSLVHRQMAEENYLEYRIHNDVYGDKKLANAYLNKAVSAYTDMLKEEQKEHLANHYYPRNQHKSENVLDKEKVESYKEQQSQSSGKVKYNPEQVQKISQPAEKFVSMLDEAFKDNKEEQNQTAIQTLSNKGNVVDRMKKIEKQNQVLKRS